MVELGSRWRGGRGLWIGRRLDGRLDGRQERQRRSWVGVGIIRRWGREFRVGDSFVQILNWIEVKEFFFMGRKQRVVCFQLLLWSSFFFLIWQGLFLFGMIVFCQCQKQIVLFMVIELGLLFIVNFLFERMGIQKLSWRRVVVGGCKLLEK